MSQLPGQTENSPQPAGVASNGKGKGVASLVLGIIGILSCFTGIGAIIGLVCGIVGVILGAQARKRLPAGENGIATAGWICSIIALVICGIALFFALGILALFGMASSL